MLSCRAVERIQSMSKRPIVNVLVLSVAIIIGASSYVVRAAGVHPDQGLVANVDMARVFAESDVRKGIDKNIQAFGSNLGKHFDEIGSTPYLTADEISDYSAALNAENPTDNDKKKIETIKAASAKRVDEVQKLSAVKQPTPADQTRMRELENMQRQRPVFLDRLQKIYQAAMDEEEQKRTRAGLAEVRGIVGKMAKDQGFSQVYDVTSMVYAPTDLTEQAMRKTQTKKK
jgi:Skp family chaperone for outer membrane proteins